jgi:hypothetical protein
MVAGRVVDPMKFIKLLWPDVYITQYQRKILYSLVENTETYVPAGNMLGKDFIASFAVLWFFLSRHPVRIVTTSAKDDHLRVLWGEIGQRIATSKYPLDYRQGGPLVLNHHDIRKIDPFYGDKYAKGKRIRCPISYMIGMVASADSIAAMQGHHVTARSLEEANDGIPRTLFVSDESSSVPDAYYTMASTWFKRALIIGNTWQCENFWKRGVKGGNVPADDDTGTYYRRVIQVKAEDSPNIRLALAQIAKGEHPTGEVLVPGVKDYETYKRNLATWDDEQIAVSLHAEFYEGAEVKMFPLKWRERAWAFWKEHHVGQSKAETIGVDPAEGGDSTCWANSGKLGVRELISLKTTDTSVIPGDTIGMMQRLQIQAHNVLFDAGGGGKQFADLLKKQKHRVRVVAFGEAATDPDKFRKGIKTTEQRTEEAIEKYVYKNRRAEMYHLLRLKIDPNNNPAGFGLPPPSLGPVYAELDRQLAAIPLWHDEEGRIYLPKKQRKPGQKAKEEITLYDLLGCSPDEADATVLSVFGLENKGRRVIAGSIL